MSTVSGTSVTYTTNQILGSNGNIIRRTSTTAVSNDLTPLASDLISVYGGSIAVGQTFDFLVFNDSSFRIDLSGNTGFTMNPGPTDSIYPNTVKRYTVLISSGTTCDIFNVNYNGTTIHADEGMVAGGLITGTTANFSNITTDIVTVTSNYNVLGHNSIINVATTTAAGTSVINLPSISSVGRKSYQIGDISGQASDYNIYIVPSGSDTILEETCVILEADYSSVSIYTNTANNNWLIF